MQMINELDITIRRTGANIVDQATIRGGEPDQCGHRYEVAVTRHRDGTYLVQTNFNDYFESRRTYAEAIGFAMTLASQIDADGFGPDEETDDE